MYKHYIHVSIHSVVLHNHVLFKTFLENIIIIIILYSALYIYTRIVILLFYYKYYLSLSHLNYHKANNMFVFIISIIHSYNIDSVLYIRVTTFTNIHHIPEELFLLFVSRSRIHYHHRIATFFFYI